MGYFVIIALLALTACEQDDAIEEVDNDSRLETVSIEEAQKLLADFESVKTRTNSKKDSYKKFLPELDVDLNKITQQELTNSTEFITVAPIKNSSNKLFSRIIMLKINGELIQLVFTLYPTKNCMDAPQLFSGIILLTQLNQDYHSGYKVKKGFVVSRLFLKDSVVTKSRNFNNNLTASMIAEPPEDMSELYAYLDEVTIKASGGRGRETWNSFYPADLNRNIDLREPNSRWDYNKDYEESIITGSGATTHDPNPEVDDKGLEGTKAECIYNKMLERSQGFSSIVKKFMGERPVNHLKLDLDYNLPKNINATTSNLNDFSILIKINGNTLAERTVIGLARTLIHEMIHAEMKRKLISVGYELKKTDFPGIYDYYTRYKDWQHEQMAAHYINTIVNAIKSFDNNQHSNNFYEAIAWEGLTGTTSWNNLSQAEKKNIIDTIKNNKKNGNKDCM